jgi:hypothetical protein
MFVRLKTGAYAGQVRELSYKAARAMLDDGRAEQYVHGSEIPQAAPAAEMTPPRVTPVASVKKVPIATPKNKKGR